MRQRLWTLVRNAEGGAPYAGKIDHRDITGPFCLDLIAQPDSRPRPFAGIIISQRPQQRVTGSQSIHRLSPQALFIRPENDRRRSQFVAVVVGRPSKGIQNRAQNVHAFEPFFFSRVRWTLFQRVPTNSLPPAGSVPGSSSHQNHGYSSLSRLGSLPRSLSFNLRGIARKRPASLLPTSPARRKGRMFCRIPSLRSGFQPWA